MREFASLPVFMIVSDIETEDTYLLIGDRMDEPELSPDAAITVNDIVLSILESDDDTQKALHTVFEVAAGKPVGDDEDFFTTLAVTDEDVRLKVASDAVYELFRLKQEGVRVTTTTALTKEFEQALEQERHDNEQAVRQIRGQMERMMAKLTAKTSATRMYTLLLLLAFVLCGFIVSIGWAAAPNVNIEYNVGDILLGLLAGGGVAAAGGSYAVTKLRENDKGDPNHPARG